MQNVIDGIQTQVKNINNELVNHLVNVTKKFRHVGNYSHIAKSYLYSYLNSFAKYFIWVGFNLTA